MLGNLGYAAIVTGFAGMAIATAYFLQAATHSKSKVSAGGCGRCGCGCGCGCG